MCDAFLCQCLVVSHMCVISCGKPLLTTTWVGVGGKVFRIGTVRYNWPMSAHASQAFSIAHCTDSEDLPRRNPKVKLAINSFPCLNLSMMLPLFLVNFLIFRHQLSNSHSYASPIFGQFPDISTSAVKFPTVPDFPDTWPPRALHQEEHQSAKTYWHTLHL